MHGRNPANRVQARAAGKMQFVIAIEQRAGRLGPAAILGTLLFAAMPSGSPAAGPQVAACAGILVALRRRGWSILAVVLLAACLLLRGSGWADMAIWLTGTALAVTAILPQWRLRLPAHPALVLPLVLMGTGVAIAVETHAEGLPIRIFASSIGAVLAGWMSNALTRMLVGPAAPAAMPMLGGDDRILPVTRHLLLGRIANSIIHELNQSLNVVIMANGNLGYIVDRMALKDEERDQLASRVQRIATHCERAAQIISHFRCFGHIGDDGQGPATVETAFDRAIEATITDFRLGGLAIEKSGEALPRPVAQWHGMIEMVVVSVLLTVLHAAPQGAAGDEAIRKVILDSAPTAAGIIVSISSDVPPRPISGVDAATLWLIDDLVAARGGSLRRIDGAGTIRFELRFDQPIG